MDTIGMEDVNGRLVNDHEVTRLILIEGADIWNQFASKIDRVRRIMSEHSDLGELLHKLRSQVWELAPLQFVEHFENPDSPLGSRFRNCDALLNLALEREQEGWR